MATEQKIKCLVWDLDETLWQGTLLEGDDLQLFPGVKETLAELDRRGILLSIASHNDSSDAQQMLERFGVWDYFLVPQIQWGSKAQAVAEVAKQLNIGLDSVAFIDDQDYQRAEVQHSYPEVRCFAASDRNKLLDMDVFQPDFVTSESAVRRQLYRVDLERREAEHYFSGPQEDFLRTLGMRFNIHPATEADLQRAFELTVRTHQLNTSGRTYSYAELDELRQSPNHLLLLADMTDRFGAYGKIGLAVVEMNDTHWHIHLLLMSCRVVGRGVGTVLLHRILDAAFKRGLPVRADFKETGRNQMMLTTYRFAKFRTLSKSDDGLMVMEAKPYAVPEHPDYIELGGGFAGDVYGG